MAGGDHVITVNTRIVRCRTFFPQPKDQCGGTSCMRGNDAIHKPKAGEKTILLPLIIVVFHCILFVWVCGHYASAMATLFTTLLPFRRVQVRCRVRRNFHWIGALRGTWLRNQTTVISIETRRRVLHRKRCARGHRGRRHCTADHPSFEDKFQP
jgi:hypothetical protein